MVLKFGPFKESYKREVQDYTDGNGTHAASMGLFAHCLFPLPSQFWAEVESWDMREVEGEKTQRPWGTHFKLVCPEHGPLPEDGGGLGWHPNGMFVGQTDCSNSPFCGLTRRQGPLPVQYHITTLLHPPSFWEKGKLGGPKKGRLFFVLEA